jgi:hypothetical protein
MYVLNIQGDRWEKRRHGNWRRFLGNEGLGEALLCRGEQAWY